MQPSQTDLMYINLLIYLIFKNWKLPACILILQTYSQKRFLDEHSSKNFLCIWSILFHSVLILIQCQYWTILNKLQGSRKNLVDYAHLRMSVHKLLQSKISIQLFQTRQSLELVKTLQFKANSLWCTIWICISLKAVQLKFHF